MMHVIMLCIHREGSRHNTHFEDNVGVGVIIAKLRITCSVTRISVSWA